MLSPSAFNLYSKMMMRKVEDTQDVIGGIKVKKLRYADDSWRVDELTNGLFDQVVAG